MNATMIRHLVLKDWHFQRAPIAAAAALGLAGLALLQSSNGGTFYIGTVLLLTVVIGIGIFLAFLTVVHERTQGMMPFLFSLPIGIREYTAAKLVANLGLFLLPWLALGGGAAAVILTREAVPDGLLPYAVVLLLHLLTGYVLTLCAALVTGSEGWTIAVAGASNLGLQGFMYWTSHLADVAPVLSGPTVVWPASLRAIALVEITVTLLLLVATWHWQSRRTDLL